MGLLSKLFGSSKTWTASNGESVRYKRTWSKPGQITGTDTYTYEEWTAPSERAAKEYLNTRTITKSQYYLAVETPEGNWCKDKAGIYQD